MQSTEYKNIPSHRRSEAVLRGSEKESCLHENGDFLSVTVDSQGRCLDCGQKANSTGHQCERKHQ
jgi:hypothetical protein